MQQTIGKEERSKNRCKFLMTALEKGISKSTIAATTSIMAQRSESEKETIALKLLDVVQTSDTEDEILDKAAELLEKLERQE